MADPITAVLAYAALQAGHHAGDYLLQSDHQALTKGHSGRAGRRACAGHVASLTAAQALLLAGAAVVTEIGLDPVAAVLALAVNAASHFWIDRRSTLRGLVLITEPITRKKGFYESGGSAHMDQAAHGVWLLGAALIAAATPAGAAAGTGAALLVLLVLSVASRAGLAREAAAERRASSASTAAVHIG